MICHLVLFHIEDARPQADVDRLMSHLDGLASRIDGLTVVERGVDFGDKSKGYRHAALMTFRDRPALERFRAGDAHTTLVESFIKPICDDFIVVDFEPVVSEA